MGNACIIKSARSVTRSRWETCQIVYSKDGQWDPRNLEVRTAVLAGGLKSQTTMRQVSKRALEQLAVTIPADCILDLGKDVDGTIIGFKTPHHALVAYEDPVYKVLFYATVHVDRLVRRFLFGESWTSCDK